MSYEDKKRAAAAALAEIDPSQPLGTNLYDAMARVTVSVAIEAIALRRTGPKRNLEIFLRRRAMDDTAYPGEWHAPGSVMRPRETVQDVLNRLQGEFGAGVSIDQFIDNLNNPEEERGHFFTPVYLVKIKGMGRSDESHGWFPVDDLPQPMVGHHENILFPMAIAAFEQMED